MKSSGFCVLVCSGDGCCLLRGGGVLVPGPGVHLGVAGREDEHVGHEDDHAGREHGDDDGQDDVKLAVFLCMEICKVKMRNICFYIFYISIFYWFYFPLIVYSLPIILDCN